MQTQLITKKLTKDVLWKLAPILFSKEYAKEVGESPIFDFSNNIVVFMVESCGEIASFCIDEYDGKEHNWRYDYTVKKYRGIGLNKLCFDARSEYCNSEPCKIEVRESRQKNLINIGFKTLRRRGQWCFMARY